MSRENTGAKTGWSDFYTAGSDLETFFTILGHHAPLMSKLFAGNPQSTLEAGCGTATMSSLLALTGVEAIAVDNDPDVLAIAATASERWDRRPELIEHDIFDLSTIDREVDVVFSQGVLEHFSDEAIGELVTEALAIAPQFIFSVPGRWYGHRDVGNERLLEADEWQRIIEPHGRVQIESYMHEIRRNTWGRRRPLMVMGTVYRD